MSTSTATSTKLLPLSLAALGIVYGDIGTSPLYAFREALYGLPIIPENILGVLSLIFWSLIIVVSIKYLVFILRADNDGEGGILALLALLRRENASTYKYLLFVCIVGAGLLLGDGMLTPAISVISAIEGLKIVYPAFTQYVIPLTLVIILSLFLFQHLGTERIGKYFGPIILCWFTILAILGMYRLIGNPTVMHAMNPYYAIQFFHHNGLVGYTMLGGIFLVVTGGEALYADLGHFGRTPIRIGWFAVALPGLLLNYFGQGAYLLKHPDAISNPFYSLAPQWFSYPLLFIATLATIIASQAVISATFSLTRQAILLNLFPRLPIIQTSENQRGQIYIPQMNILLAVGALLLVIAFKSSSALAHAYGIAVNLEMLAVTIMVACVAKQYWQWTLVKTLSIFGVLLFCDMAFLGANMHKIVSGGWVPLVFAATCAVIMLTWQKGLKHLHAHYYKEKILVKDMLVELKNSQLKHLPEATVIFITDPYDKSGSGLLHYLKLNHFQPGISLIVSVVIDTRPYIANVDRYIFSEIGQGIYRLLLTYGFMDVINLPEALASGNNIHKFSFDLNVKDATYLVEIPHVTPTRRKSTLSFFWQEKLFAFMIRNAVLDIEFYRLPYDRSIGIGAYCEI